MNFIINLNKIQVSIPTGRASNLFKNLKMKEIEFNENEFKNQFSQMDLNKYINKEKFFTLSQKYILEIFKRKKEENCYEFGQLYVKNIPVILKDIKIDKENFIKEISISSEKVKNNPEIIEKINKLKKLKSINS